MWMASQIRFWREPEPKPAEHCERARLVILLTMSLTGLTTENLTSALRYRGITTSPDHLTEPRLRLKRRALQK